VVTMQLSSMSSFETSHRAKLLQSASLIAYLSCHVVLLGFAFEVAGRFMVFLPLQHCIAIVSG